MNTHEIFMQRAIQLAKNGLGTTYPNPLVGSVIVHNGKIIGEGWHRKAGEPHAEVNAVNSVKDKSLLKEATIYVTLEPCSHFGKTPPCCDLIINNNIPNVVVGTIDPFAKVAGTGIQKLKESGKNIMVGILEKECQDLNKRFFTFHNKKRPYIILKWAKSKDGFIAPDRKLRQAENKKKPVWISNTQSRQLVHKWRTEEQAILVGTQTVLDDNPKLDARDFYGQNPIRITFDKHQKISENSHIKNGELSTIIYTENNNLTKKEKYIYKNIIFDDSFLPTLLNDLHSSNIQSIIIEGGQKTLEGFINANLWDEARVFTGPSKLLTGIESPRIPSLNYSEELIGNDLLKIYYNYD